MIFDSHIHLCRSAAPKIEGWSCIAAFCSAEEWLSFGGRGDFPASFGVHPQALASLTREEAEAELSFLDGLLSRGELFAVGEIGLDLFTAEFRAAEAAQEEFWRRQLEMARNHGRPVVVHCRRAIDRLFRDSRELSRLPAVVLHSFPGSPQDARSLLRRGVNAYLSLGKHQVMNGKRATMEILSHADEFAGRILLETDAPYQTLRGEERTEAADILRVCARASEIAGRDMGGEAEAAARRLLSDCGSKPPA